MEKNKIGQNRKVLQNLLKMELELMLQEMEKPEICRNLTGESVGEGSPQTATPGKMFAELMHYYKDFDFIVNMTDEEFIEAYEKLPKEEETAVNRIYCGTEDYVEFFKTVISTLGLEDILRYEVEEVDGEMEVVVFND